MKRRAITFILAAMTLLAFMIPAAALAWSSDAVVYANSDPERYTVELDLTNNITTVYERVDGDRYGKIALQAACSPGAVETPTPVGTWRLNSTRRRFGFFSKYNCYAQYWVNVIGGIYFHSILYNSPVEGDFTRTSYNAIGNKASHGCIRMLVEDVRWIYYNCPPGTLCVVTDKKAKNDELRESLLPTARASEYEPEPDEYEATLRNEPVGLVRRSTIITDANGMFRTQAEQGEKLTIIYSDVPKTRVTLKNGVTGYIDNADLYFYDNGPDAFDTKYTVNKNSNLYPKANNTTEPVTVLDKGTELTITASTRYFHKVVAGEYEGYILKGRVTTKTTYNGEEPKLKDEDEGEVTFRVKRIKSDSAKIYPKPNNIDEPLAEFLKGTDVYEISGSTTNFHKVKVGDITGYILKRNVSTYEITLDKGTTYEPRLFTYEEEVDDDLINEDEDEDETEPPDDGNNDEISPDEDMPTIESVF